MRSLVLQALVLAVVRPQEQEHFLDVRQIVKGTIEAMQRLPEAAIQQPNISSSTAKPDDLMSLFKLPADIMTNLAVGAGYIQEPKTSTYGPWIVARNKEQSGEESDSSEKVKRKNKRKKPEDDGLVNIKDLLRLPAATGVPPAMPQVPSFFSPVQGDTAGRTVQQDPLYKKEVAPDGQVRFVPVYPSPPTPRPFVQAGQLPIFRKRVQQSVQRFEAQTFPPAINPFQQDQAVFPPRIIQPLPVAPQLPPTAAPIPQPIPLQPRQVQPALEDPPVEQIPQTPFLVHSVMPKEESKFMAVQPMKIAQNEESRAFSEEFSESKEDESMVYSEESEAFPSPRRAVIGQTSLRVRTNRFSEEEERTESKLRRKNHPAKKRVKVAPVDDEPTTEPPTASRPTPVFEKAMEDIERPRISKRRRVHASKTLKVDRKKERTEKDERVSDELEQISSQSSRPEEEEEQSVETTTPRRRTRLWKKQTIRPKSRMTATTKPIPRTSTEEEEEEDRIEIRKKKRRQSEKKKKQRIYKRRRTTVGLSTTTASSSVEVTAQHCANIRSFARQFGIFDIRKFAKKHCDFIENYYAELTCERADEYVRECQKWKRN